MEIRKLTKAEKLSEWKTRRKSAGLCVNCGKKNNDSPKDRCDECINKSKEKALKVRKYRKDNDLCIRCGTPDVSRGKKSKTCENCYQQDQKRLKKMGREKLRRQSVKRKTTRIKALQIISGTEYPVCANCKCNDIHLLEIHHLKNDGKKDYRSTGVVKSFPFYNNIVKGKRKTYDLQVLCKVCNIMEFARRKSKGEWTISWTEYLCDICNKECKLNYAILEAAWGYYSNSDGIKLKCVMCEDCFAKVKNYIENNLKGKVESEEYL